MEQGEPLPVMASKSSAEKTIGDIHFGLARRLHVPRFPSDIETRCDTTNWDYIGFGLPVSYIAPEQLLLWRISLSLELSSPGRTTQQTSTSSEAPLAFWMDPTTNTSSTTPISGEVGLDAGKVAALAPFIKDVFTANFKIPFQATKYSFKVQAYGHGLQNCNWLVSGPEIARSFHPAVIAELPATRPLEVQVKLHIEVRKQVAGVFHMAYAISDPDISLSYAYRPATRTLDAIDPNVPQPVTYWNKPINLIIEPDSYIKIKPDSPALLHDSTEADPVQQSQGTLPRNWRRHWRLRMRHILRRWHTFFKRPGKLAAGREHGIGKVVGGLNVIRVS